MFGGARVSSRRAKSTTRVKSKDKKQTRKTKMLSSAAVAKCAKLLSKLADHYYAENDLYRAGAYLKASKNVADTRDLHADIPGVGVSIRQKIDEFIATGDIKIPVADKKPTKTSAKSSAKSLTEKSLTKSSAKSVATKSSTKSSTKSLSSHDKKLSADVSKQTSGSRNALMMKYSEDLKVRIPRNIVERIGKIVIRALESVGVEDAVLAGSYRRGSATSGDVDICSRISHEINIEDVKSAISALDGFVGFIMAGQERISFLIIVAQHARQVDILMVQPEEYIYGLLYMTGSRGFNIGMRGIAAKKNLTLNQHGLFTKSGGRLKNIATEQDIFLRLGLKYAPPTERSDAKALVFLTK